MRGTGHGRLATLVRAGLAVVAAVAGLPPAHIAGAAAHEQVASTVYELVATYPRFMAGSDTAHANQQLSMPYSFTLPNQYQVQVNPGTVTAHYACSAGHTMAGAAINIDWTATFQYPVLPAQLTPGQSIAAHLSASGSGNLKDHPASDDPKLARRIGLTWTGFTTPSSSSTASVDYAIEIGNATSGGKGALISNASDDRTFVVPSPKSDGQSLGVMVVIGGSGGGCSIFNASVEYFYRATTKPSAKPTPAAEMTDAQEALCGDRLLAFDEIRMRWKATRLALERERNLHSQLDLAHEDLRQSIYASAVIDVASLAPGWPLSSGVANAFFSAEKDKIANELLKAGFRSVEQRVAKDPSLSGVADQLSTLSLTEGAPSDVGWEAVKHGMAGALGETWSDTSFFAFDIMKFGFSTYEGWNQLDASLDMIRRVNEHILQLDQLDRELTSILTDAQSASDLCLDAVAKHVAPDDSLTSWQNVVAYLSDHQ